ncbi:MAG TPA: plastocyanin/azurin family copper-binding protein [Gemmatimonadaceae bacterium]|nr:plastocyanin/azurin family copper-binding protein [Gemmatimonadaceae bacterium]
MQITRILAGAAGMIALACGGADNTNAAATGDTAAVVAAGTPATTTPTPAGTPAAISGTTHEVRMMFENNEYKFSPANLTIKVGDGVKWIMVSGGPHNAAFDAATVPASAKAQLLANMPNQMSELSGPLLINPNDTYTMSFANVPAGTYNYFCTPHLAMNMRGVITVQ